MGLCQANEPDKLRPLYGLHSESDLEETELDHLAGYRNSRPVRIGNEAANQTQLDIYGELLLAVDEVIRLGRSLDGEEWQAIHDTVEYVREVWDEPDAGIWEVRGGNQQFVYSKVMCWVALDRGMDTATEHGYDAPVEEWRGTRETIKEDVIEQGYDEDIGAFVQAYDTDTLDASALLFPIVGFLPFDDDRVQRTIDAIEDRLGEDDALVKRYDGEDGLPGEEGAFVLCSSWLVDALALSGRVEEACERFEALTEYVRDLPPSAKLVYKTLEYADGWLIQPQIAAKARLSQRTVRYGLERLQSVGVLDTKPSFMDARQTFYRVDC